MSETLRDQFRKAVRDAKTSLDHFSAAPDSYYTSLWQVIVGPPHSGKTYAAQAYADNLAEAGLTHVPARFMSSGIMERDIPKAFADAKGGTLIIDDPDHLGKPAAQTLYEEMIKAFDAQSCVIVLTGYRSSVDPFLENMPDMLKARWKPEAHETERSFTREEAEAFDAADRVRRDAAAARAVEIEKWRTLAEIDVSTPKTVTPMRTVRFGRTAKPAPSPVK